ncbi:hypothetical protein KUTeg_022417 [Tegillarca granosa]|uniref:Lysosomal Pro-X carboxypeptidase n=1 Tax=Tegillarca granosa TaxID=220873 RepID=A0ABQ9ECB7_TEGGR|nr:hypothetical protein KUTeg_022417 [Tegillarca granosa]
MPFGNNSFNHPYVGLLTIEQAMGDYAYLINKLKETLNATKCPVITFGGSYGGMLSAYMRFKYPNLVSGSIAASAPIFLLSTNAKRDFFFEDVSNSSLGYQKLSEVFQTCKTLTTESEYNHLLGWIRNSFTNLAMFDYPYPTSFIYIMKNNNPLYGLAQAAGLFYNGTDGKLKCFDIFTDFVECADPTGCGVGPTSWAWDFQACTEVSLVSGSNNVTDMFPEMPFTPEIRQEYCKKRWNVTPRQDWKSIQFWGKDISSASNIVFSNGDLDPWRRGGVLSSSNPNVATILIKGGAHHLDLRGHNPKDPATVVQARATEKAYIHKWIKSHWNTINKEKSLYEKIKTWLVWLLFHY